MRPVSRPKSPKGPSRFPRMARSGSSEALRPNAGGYGIGCAARTQGGVFPARPWGHTPSCASEGGSLAARPRGRAAASRPCHVFPRSADRQSALESPRAPCRASLQRRTPKADSQSAFPRSDWPSSSNWSCCRGVVVVWPACRLSGGILAVPPI